MCNRKIFFFIATFFFLFSTHQVQAQKIVTNDNGNKIVVYPDGSWHYYEQAQDSTDVYSQGGDPELSANKKPKKKKKKKKAKNNKAKKRKKEKKNEDPLDEAKERRRAIQRAERAAAIEEELRLQKEEAIFKRIFLEEELEEAYHDINMTNDDLMRIDQRLKAALENEKAAEANYAKAKERAKLYEKMIDMSAKKRKKFLAKMNDDISFPEDNQALRQDIVAEPNFDNLPDYNASTPSSPPSQAYVLRPPIRKYQPKHNLLRYPPEKPCTLAFDDVDEFSGKKRKQTQKVLFFAHTPERFRSYFKGRNYLLCEGSLVEVNGTPRNVNITFTIATDQAAREFGILEKNSQLIVRFINGKRLILFNAKTTSGIVDPVTKTTTYTASYPLNKGQIKTLKDEEVDKLRVIWGTGYEDYEVYYVDFFKDLFRCLQKG